LLIEINLLYFLKVVIQPLNCHNLLSQPLPLQYSSSRTALY